MGGRFPTAFPLQHFPTSSPLKHSPATSPSHSPTTFSLQYFPSNISPPSFPSNIFPQYFPKIFPLHHFPSNISPPTSPSNIPSSISPQPLLASPSCASPALWLQECLGCLDTFAHTRWGWLSSAGLCLFCWLCDPQCCEQTSGGRAGSACRPCPSQQSHF